MEIYSRIINGIKTHIDHIFRLIPEDERGRLEYMSRLSIYENVYLMGELAEIDAFLSQLNIIKITQKDDLTFDEIVQERKIEKPIKQLFERIVDIKYSLDNSIRANYDADLMSSIGSMRTARTYDITGTVSEKDIDDIVTTVKKHTDIRITLQSQLVNLLGGYLANIDAYIKGKEIDYLCFYEVVKDAFSLFQYSKEEIKYIEDDAFNLLYTDFDGEGKIIKSYSKLPTLEDWGELLERKFRMNQKRPLFSVFEKIDNRKQFYELDHYAITDAIYYHCKDHEELQDFYNEFVTLNYIKKQIMDTQNMNPEKLIQTNFEDNHGVVISGGSNNISIKIGKDGVEMESQPAPKSSVDILDREVKAKVLSNAKPKSILMPVRAAMEVSVPLPFSNVVEFNARYGSDISSSAWSRWINDTEGCGYDSKEINPYITMFSTL